MSPGSRGCEQLRRAISEQAALREALLSLHWCKGCADGIKAGIADWVMEEVLMRERSEWEFECYVCGELIISSEPHGICCKCGTEWRIEDGAESS
jgi:hypothetical protein